MHLPIEFILLWLLPALSMSLRGGTFHNYLAHQAATTLRRAGCRVSYEHPLFLTDGRRNDVDLLVSRNGQRWICEVETTARHAQDNAAKAQLAGLPLWIIVPTRRLRQNVRRKLDLNSGSKVPIKILLPDQVLSELTRCFPLFSAANGSIFPRKTNPSTPSGPTS